MVTLTEWYKGVHLPEWGSGMLSFLQPSAGLLSTLLPATVPVMFSQTCDTAFADRNNFHIVCGVSFVAPNEKVRLNPFASKHEAITFGLALIAHEGAHFAWSPETLGELLNQGVPSNKATTTIANVVEDIYIENRLIVDFPQLAWIIVGGWEYLFDPRVTALREVKAWDGVSITDENLGDAINTFIGWKHQYRTFPMRSEFERELYEMFMSVCGMHSLQARKDLIQAIIEKLAQKFESDSKNEDGDGDGSGDGEQRTQGGKSGKLSEVDGYYCSGVFTPDSKYMPRHEVLKASQSASRYGAVNNNGQTIEVGLENNKAVFVTDMGKAMRINMAYDRRWNRLSEIANQRGAVRSVQGLPKATGKRLSHPLNASGNGKVFSNTTLESTSGRIFKAMPQVILLVDFSGSMKHSGKIDGAITAAYGASVGLENAGIKFACYGYTTQDSATKMYLIKEFSENGLAARQRLSKLYQNSSVGMSSTPDLEAIEFVSKKFTNNGGDKILIVMSDGQPSNCRVDSSNTPIEDVRLLVNDLRRTGINIFGLSVDDSADAPMREIYGSKYFIPNSDPNAIDKFIAYFI